MAERLTRNNKVNFCFHDEASNMVYYKLRDFEDTMEKYGIESVEVLDRLINVWKLRDVVDKMEESTNNLYKQSGCIDLEKDRDAWKRACELACEEIDCEYMYGINKENYSQYFYQQAKKEGDSI